MCCHCQTCKKYSPIPPCLRLCFSSDSSVQVAVKVIDKKKAKADPYVAKYMRREAKLMMMLLHPNVLKLLEVVETDNSYYLVTEMAEGGDLMDRICKKHYLPEQEVRKFIKQIVSAVDYLHRSNIVHR